MGDLTKVRLLLHGKPPTGRSVCQQSCSLHHGARTPIVLWLGKGGDMCGQGASTSPGDYGRPFFFLLLLWCCCHNVVIILWTVLASQEVAQGREEKGPPRMGEEMLIGVLQELSGVKNFILDEAVRSLLCRWPQIQMQPLWNEKEFSGSEEVYFLLRWSGMLFFLR